MRLFRSHYRLTPSALRRTVDSKPAPSDCLRLVLAYRPPFDWEALLRFLAARAIPGVECVTGAAYHRTVGVGEHRGWLSVSPVADRNLLAVDLATSLAPALPSILARLRNLFDLDARPDVIASHLALDPMLAPWVKAAARAARARRVRFVRTGHAGHPGTTSFGARRLDAGRPLCRAVWRTDRDAAGLLESITPTAEAIAAARSATLAGLGLPIARAECLRNLARVVARREIDLEPGVDPTAIVAKLDGASRHWTVDGGIHRHARLALARCISCRRPGIDEGLAIEVGPRLGESGRAVASLAGLRGHAPVGKPQNNFNRRVNHTRNYDDELDHLLHLYRCSARHDACPRRRPVRDRAVHAAAQGVAGAWPPPGNSPTLPSPPSASNSPNTLQASAAI